MARLSTHYHGGVIALTDKPSCPHCTSRRRVEDGPRDTIETDEGVEIDVWLCVQCPSRGGRTIPFGVVVPPAVVEEVRAA